MKTEGRNAVLELLKTEKTIDKLYLEKGAQGTLGRIFAEARKKGLRVQFVEKKVLDKLSETGRHQGVIAETTDFVYTELEELVSDRTEDFLVLCDGIEDVHNLGSILRVCECAGVSGVILPRNNSASVNESVMRISAGAAEHMRVARVASLNQTIAYLQERGYWVYALEAGEESIYAADLKGKIALVIGGEDSGVHRLVKERCDKVLSLPLYGKVNSLNASVALGIACYEAVRQRKGL